MKLLLTILLFTSCVSSEIQVREITVTLVKVSSVSHGKKWQTWLGSDGIQRVIEVDKSNGEKEGFKKVVFTKR